MGVLNRIKKAPSGVGETIDDVRKDGLIGGFFATIKRFGSRNAEAAKTIGEDVMKR